MSASLGPLFCFIVLKFEDYIKGLSGTKWSPLQIKSLKVGAQTS